MINEQVFRLKKNGKPYCDCFCRHPELIENYDLAISDNTQTWECHHRFEALFTKQELIKYNWYYDVEPNCLIFLTPAEHNTIHDRRKNRKDQSKKVLCVETGEVFESIMEAERQTGIYSPNISKVCLGRKRFKTAGGYHWKFL